MAEYFTTRTQEQQTNILAQYLPDNKLFEQKYNDAANIRKLLLGLAVEFGRKRGVLNDIRNEYFPSGTTQFLSDWERQVGIPSDCIPVAATDQERRDRILLKLASINATTKKQFENIITALGFAGTVSNATDESGLPLTLPFILISEDERPFTIIVTLDASLQGEVLPLTLPFTLSSAVPEILECLFNRLIPAHCQVYFRYA